MKVEVEGAKEKTRGDAPCCSSRVMDPSCLFTTDEGESGTQTRLTKQTNKQTNNNCKQQQTTAGEQAEGVQRQGQQLTPDVTNRPIKMQTKTVQRLRKVTVISFMYATP